MRPTSPLLKRLAHLWLRLILSFLKPGLHASFKLNKNGEEVGLFDVNGNKLLDAVIFGAQKADRSFGCVPDGGRDFFYLWQPSGNGPLLGTGTGQAVRFDTRRTGSPSGFDLKVSGTPRAGKVFTFELRGGTANGPVALGISLGMAPVNPLYLGPVGTLLLSPSTLVVGFTALDGQGNRSVGATVPASAIGITLHGQALNKELSNAVAVRFSQ